MIQRRKPETILAFTDGSCVPNPGFGGFGLVLLCRDKELHVSGFKNEATDNQMELTAVLEACRFSPAGSRIIIFTDSNTVIGWLKKGFTNSPVNRQLLKNTFKEIDRKNIELHTQKVMGHSGVHFNEIADRLAAKHLSSFESRELSREAKEIRDSHLRENELDKSDRSKFQFQMRLIANTQ
jgi:ribonuclease HI